jgi:PKD repeat protein
MKKLHVVIVMLCLALVTIGIVSAVEPVIPTVNFIGVPDTGHEDLTVTFTATTTNMTPPLSYEWDFGDSSGAVKLSGTSIVHTYLNPGLYSVRLAANDLGVPVTTWVSITKTDYIRVTHIPPVAGFTFAPPTGASPLFVTFTDTTTGFEPELLWDFGDGTPTTTDKNPVHTFHNMDSTETYTITLTATNDGGTDTFTDTITVLPQRPMADFVAVTATTGGKPLAVQFTGIAAGVGDKTYEWSFGDGGTSDIREPIHTYTTVGLFNVSFTVTTPSGSDTKIRINYINVTKVPPPVICPVCPEPTQCPTPPTTHIVSKTGVYRPGVGFFLKINTDVTWNPLNSTSPDIALVWDNAGGDLPVAGDWNGDGMTETGVYRPGAGFYLKMDNGNVWSSSDKYLAWDNAVGDLPISGNWNVATIQSETGVYRPGSGFYLKMDDGNAWNSSTDVTLAWDNAAGDRPVSVN